MMIENATYPILQIGGKLIGIKAFFLETWIGNFLIFISFLFSIGMWVYEQKKRTRGDRCERFRQTYDELLKPSEVQLRYDNKHLVYTKQNHQEWNGFIDEVNKQIKRKFLRYNARGLYKKTEKRFKEFEESSKSFRLKVNLIVQDVNEKNDCGFLVWDGGGDPPECCIEKESIPKIFENVIGGIGIEIYKSGYGGYAFKRPNQTVKAKSENKLKKLSELIQLAIDNDEEIKKMLSKRNRAEKDAYKSLNEYNNKLAKVIHDLRLYQWW